MGLIYNISLRTFVFFVFFLFCFCVTPGGVTPGLVAFYDLQPGRSGPKFFVASPEPTRGKFRFKLMK